MSSKENRNLISNAGNVCAFVICPICISVYTYIYVSVSVAEYLAVSVCAAQTSAINYKVAILFFIYLLCAFAFAFVSSSLLFFALCTFCLQNNFDLFFVRLVPRHTTPRHNSNDVYCVPLLLLLLGVARRVYLYKALH